LSDLAGLEARLASLEDHVLKLHKTQLRLAKKWLRTAEHQARITEKLAARHYELALALGAYDGQIGMQAWIDSVLKDKAAKRA
jgi:hypothetical protein